MRITTDYLVIGAGASGLAFTDALVAERSDAEVTLVDRRPEPGGHWQQAYPFVRLHSPSAYYGVNSLALGEDRIDAAGENSGFYERATGAEVRDYFGEVAARLAETGRVRFLPGSEHPDPGGGDNRVRDLDSGFLREVEVRRKIVDARYLEASVPATHRRPFEVADGARVVPVNDLPAVAEQASTFTVLGSGKTAVDACGWLLENSIEPDRIRWVRPREAWFHDRAHFQPLDQVGKIMWGLARDAEAGAQAEDLDDLCQRLEDVGRLWRIDPSRPATMYRGTMLSRPELEALRSIEDVVRLGHVQRIEPDRISLEAGEVAARRETVHIDCTARGLSDGPATPVFQPGRIVLQQVRHNSPTFNAALIGYIEGRGGEDVDRNRLCAPNPYARSIGDWPRMMSSTWKSEGRWLRDPDLMSWLGGSRLNLLGALPAHAAEPDVRAALDLYLANVGPAVKRLAQLN